MKQQFKQTEYSHNNATLEQESASTELPQAKGAVLTIPYSKVMDRFPRPLQQFAGSIFYHAQDPQPEEVYEKYQSKIRSKTAYWGWFPLLTLISAFGLLLIAYAFGNSRDGGTGLSIFFYPSLLVIFTPTAMRLISPSASRAERISLLSMTAVSLYFVKVLSSPLHFSYFDEFLHWRTVDDIGRSGHLFVPNALLPVSPYYPGLEIITNAFSTLSKVDTFHSGLIVLGAAHLLLVLTLFALNEQILKSSRMASIATIIYMVNPHFLVFDSQFAYESLALPLAIFVLFAIAPHQRVSTRQIYLGSMDPFIMFAKTQHKGLNENLRWITFTAWITLGAVTLTHHVTDIFFVGLLLLWTIIYGFLRLTSLFKSTLARTTLLGILLTVVWVGIQGNPVVGYISSFLQNSLNELGHILIGAGGARHLFVTYTGQPTPLWERGIMAFSVGTIILCLPFGLLCILARYRGDALTFTLGIVSLLYPISQVFRFTNSGAQLTDRAAAFLFIPIASILAIFIAQFWPTRQLNRKKTSLIVCVISLVFLGGVSLGAGPGLSALPGPYEVGADSRSLEPEGIQAATWTLSQLGPNNRIATDRTNQILMGTFGDQRIVTSIEDNIDVSSLFFSPQFGSDQLSLLNSAQARYLVVDLRLARSLPLIGFYFVEGEPQSYQRTRPVDLKALTKFNTVPQMNRIFDSGDIVIYDTGELINAPQKH